MDEQAAAEEVVWKPEAEPIMLATPYGAVPMPAGADPESEHWPEYFKAQLAIIRPLWVRGQREDFPLQSWSEWMRSQDAEE